MEARSILIILLAILSFDFDEDGDIMYAGEFGFFQTIYKYNESFKTENR